MADCGLFGGSSRASALVLAAVVIAGHGAALRSALVVSRDMVAGDGSMTRLRPGPRYPVLRVPDTPDTARYGAENRIAGDFAQVYFPAREFGAGTAYSERTPDPWGRQSRYPPAVHWACAVTICLLPYGQASLAHMLVQYVVFAGSFAYAFYALGIARYLPLAFLGVNVGLFLTPVGVSWFERGQFSLYIAAAYTWLLLGVYRTNAVFLGIAVLLAFVKWTSFPLFVVVLGAWLLASDRVVFARRVRAALAAVLIFVALFLLFPMQGIEFLEGAIGQENLLRPDGLSLARAVPRRLVRRCRSRWPSWEHFGCAPKTPVAQSSAGPEGDFERLLPFVLGAAILLLLYPTLAFDYSVPCLFGLIPFAIHWARWRSMPEPVVPWLVPAIFFLFIAGASTMKVFDVLAAADTDPAMIWVYMGCAILLMAVPTGAPRLEGRT